MGVNCTNRDVSREFFEACRVEIYVHEDYDNRWKLH
jgi:hypothetical protein